MEVMPERPQCSPGLPPWRVHGCRVLALVGGGRACPQKLADIRAQVLIWKKGPCMCSQVKVGSCRTGWALIQ